MGAPKQRGGGDPGISGSRGFVRMRRLWVGLFAALALMAMACEGAGAGDEGTSDEPRCIERADARAALSKPLPPCGLIRLEIAWAPTANQYYVQSFWKVPGDAYGESSEQNRGWMRREAVIMGTGEILVRATQQGSSTLKVKITVNNFVACEKEIKKPGSVECKYVLEAGGW